MMPVVAALESCVSDSYPAATPEISIVVATHNRVQLLPGLVAALTAQTADAAYEVLVVDDGSTDDTWRLLRDVAATTSLPLLALRIPATGGPSIPRNTAAARARAGVVAFTDDDCLPEPGWVAALMAEVERGARLVRGPVLPADEPHGPWARTVVVDGPTPWYETCNLAVGIDEFAAAGGFPVLELLPRRRGSRGFGEDVVLGRRVAATAAEAWAATAVVRHRWLPGTFADHLRGQARVVGFPLLVRGLPDLRETLWCGIFLDRRTAAFDAAVCAAVLAATRRRVSPLVAAAPWLVLVWTDARRRSRFRAPLRGAQLAIADAVTAVALVEGSVRARRVVL